jgi:hypothetical protein
MSGRHDDVMRMAQALARNAGYAVFPVGEDKKPFPRSRGFKDASKDPDEIAGLWRRWPGPLIGIATGGISNRIVLDLDAKHDTARAFWHTYRKRLPTTFCQRTRGGGFHFYFRATAQVRCSTGRNDAGFLGVDVRGDGGYVVSWLAAGFPVLCEERPTAWPDWLTELVQPRPPPPRRAEPWTPPEQASAGFVRATIIGLVRSLAETKEGNRNAHTNWSAYHLRDHIRAGHLTRREAEAAITEAARATGLQDREIALTINSALKGV